MPPMTMVSCRPLLCFGHASAVIITHASVVIIHELEYQSSIVAVLSGSRLHKTSGFDLTGTPLGVEGNVGKYGLGHFGGSFAVARPSPRRYFDFFFQAEDGIRDLYVTGVQTCALPI